MASFWFQSSLRFIMQREATQAIDLDGDAGLKVMLLDAGYTPNKDNDFVDDSVPGTNEIVATNYTGGFGGAGRKALATKAVNLDNTNDRAVWDADDVVWTSLGGATNDTVATAVYFKEITSDALSPVVLQLDINPDVTTNGGNLTIEHAAGATLGIGYIGA